MNPFSLNDKTILVTGASAGIGRAIAVACSQMGAKLVITGRNEKRLNETLNLLNGEKHLTFIADLADSVELSELVDFLPKLDGYVSNAGIVNPIVLQQMDEDDINKVIHINTLVPINLTRQLIQKKKLNKTTSIVFISSINGNNCSSVGNTIYASSKAALNGFAKSLALELAPREIRVNCINPGMIETDLFKSSAIDEVDLNNDKLKYPLKRYGKPAEVAFAAIYLLSDASKWVTGSSLLIDGGYTLL
jgi:NAD(P)-dependent dehydrogenase (short-subunit alcohol dehydrogenase family)